MVGQRDMASAPAGKNSLALDSAPWAAPAALACATVWAFISTSVFLNEFLRAILQCLSGNCRLNSRISSHQFQDWVMLSFMAATLLIGEVSVDTSGQKEQTIEDDGENKKTSLRHQRLLGCGILSFCLPLPPPLVSSSSPTRLPPFGVGSPA